MNTINFNQLKPLAIFVIVIESGSFAEAARRLNTSRSRISEQIAQLEEALGLRLIHRSTRKLAITTEGQAVFEQARQLPQILQDIEGSLTPSIPCGRVSITMNNDIAMNHVLPVLSDFQLQYPDIDLDLIISDEKRDLIAEQIDIGIRIGTPKDSSLIARAICEEGFAIFASPDYLQQYGHPQSIQELEEHHWLVMPQAGAGGLQKLSNNGKAAYVQPKRFHSITSPLMIQQMVIKGLGIACLLPSTVKQDIQERRLIPVMPELTGELFRFSLVYPSRHQVPLRTRCVIDYLLQADLFAYNG